MEAGDIHTGFFSKYRRKQFGVGTGKRGAQPVLAVLKGEIHMREITSPENPNFKKLTALSRKKERDKQGRYVVEGPNLVREAFLSSAPPEALFFRQSAVKDREMRELCLRGSETAGFVLKDSLFDKAAQTESPQGVMAVVRKPVWTEEMLFGSGEHGNVLVLDRLQDPGNIGTILRTALGAGFAGAILMKGGGDLYSPKTARACAGALFRLPVLFCDTPEEALSLLDKRGKRVYATALSASKAYDQCDLREDIALVIGNEGNGVRREFQDGADALLTIPMAGELESLNAAVAAGILMYEAVRQRRQSAAK